jgi:hypothetical protein
MNKLIVSLIMLQATVAGKINNRREAGQGTLEYIAMLLIAGVLIVALVGIFTGVGTQLAGKVQAIIQQITSIG